MISLGDRVGIESDYRQTKFIPKTIFDSLTQEQRRSGRYLVVTDRQYQSLQALDEINKRMITPYKPLKSEVEGVKRICKGLKMTFGEMRIGLGCSRDSTEIYNPQLLWCGVLQTCRGVCQLALPIMMFMSYSVYKSKS